MNRADARTMNLLETPHTIGGVTSALIGVATEVVRTADLGVLIAPAPGQTRTGAHRLHVRLARELALAGVPSLRFDPADGGDCSPDAAPGARYDGDIVAAAAHLRTLHPGASIALAAFGGAALPLVRSLQALKAASLPCSVLCLIDPALEGIRPIEARGWWRKLTGRPSRTMQALGEAPTDGNTDELAWLALPKTLQSLGCSLQIVSGHDAHTGELMRNLVDEDRGWRRTLRAGEALRDIAGADAVYSQPEHWRAASEWIVQELTRRG